MPNKAVTESELWAWMKRNTRSLGPDLHMTRIENLAGVGTPDVEGCYKGNQFWIELKCEPRPARPSTKIKPKFRKSQKPWHRKRKRAGANVWVLTQVGSGRDACRYLIDSKYLEEMEAGLTEAELTTLMGFNPKASAEDLIFIASDLMMIF